MTLLGNRLLLTRLITTFATRSFPFRSSPPASASTIRISVSRSFSETSMQKRCFIVSYEMTRSTDSSCSSSTFPVTTVTVVCACRAALSACTSYRFEKISRPVQIIYAMNKRILLFEYIACCLFLSYLPDVFWQFLIHSYLDLISDFTFISLFACPAKNTKNFLN